MTEKTLSWVTTILESEDRLVASNLAGHDADSWFGASVDTRGECVHRIFFALKGEKTDGHSFAEEAHARGCSAVVVEDRGVVDALSRARIPHFHVRGTLGALQELSRAYRNTLDVRVVAVTGSMGKTTTKEYIRAILKKKYRVHSNRGNLNNHIGVPLTVLETDHDTEHLICEIAANHLGEIEFLSRLLRPDIGLVTNIGDAHIGYFGSRDKIAEAKSEIFTGIDREGYAVLPSDDEFIDRLRQKADCRMVTFGRKESSTYVISQMSEEHDRIRFEINGLPLEIRGIGEYNVLNAGAAYVVGELCGVEMDRIRGALAEMEPIPGRSKVHRGRGIVVIDDSYNANPTSMRAAVETLIRLEQKRRLAVLGDMAELGDYSDAAHREIGRFLAGRGVDRVYWYGENGGLVAEGFSGGRAEKRFKWYRSVEELIRDLKSEIKTGDAVLVKASRVCHLDRVVDGLLESVLEQEKN